MDAFEPQIRELLAAWPLMPATVIAERIGWQRGMSVLRDRVQELRPTFVPADPVSRTAYQPGELVQCDLWFPPAQVPLGWGQCGQPPVLVMVSGLPAAAGLGRRVGRWPQLGREIGADQ